MCWEILVTSVFIFHDIVDSSSAVEVSRKPSFGVEISVSPWEKRVTTADVTWGVSWLGEMGILGSCPELLDSSLLPSVVWES